MIRERKSLKNQREEETMPRAESNPRIYIGWAENGRFCCIVHPPNRATNTENAEKRKKLEQKMFHVKHFML